MMQFLARLFITAFGLWVADLLLENLYFDGSAALLLAAFLLGVANAVVRPIVFILTLPITVLTFGVFLLVINGAMLLLVARLMDSFHLEGLGTAVAGWIIVAVTGWLANTYIGKEKMTRPPYADVEPGPR